MDQAIQVAENKVYPEVTDFCAQDSPVHRCIHAVVHLIQDHADRLGIPARFCATKAIEGDDAMVRQLKLDGNERDLLEHCIMEMEHETGLDRNAALADMRYDFIENVVDTSVVKCHESREHRHSMQIDRILTGKYTALPFFFGVMFLVFWLTFNVLGAGLSNLMSLGIDKLTALVDAGLTAYGINPVVHSLIIKGVFAGVGSVLSFLPIIVVLFLFLSMLEDTGYMARVAFVMDRALRKIGLSGRSFVPMLIGFGCSVPAIMATRTVSSDRDRKMTILLTPYMSCSAKIPIYAVFSAAFFPGHGALVMISLYAVGIVLGILVALVMKNTLFRGNPVPFVMELPNYRFPSVKSVALLLWEKARDFLQRAFTVIFIATIIIWFLQTFDTRLNVVVNSSDSLLALIGQMISPIFKPLGFNDWRVTTALISGFTAKEAVVSTLSVLLNTGTKALSGALSSLFTPRSAVSFLVFTLLYTPCVAAVATIRRELHSVPATIGVIVMQCVVAWLAGCLVFQIGGLLI
jgi:ferrous iron transport protein B